MDHYRIKVLKETNPALKLINADNSPLIISFLYQQFKEKNILELPKSELESSLSNYIYYLKTQEGINIYRRQPAEYLEEWTNLEYLRSRYFTDDKIILELTHYTEKALDWIKNLIYTRKFVGTETRLIKIINTLKELSYESTKDPTERLKELEKQKKEINLEIEKIEAGIIETLTETQIKERYFETCQTINEMLRDFKEIEYNFRQLDIETRKKLVQTNIQKGNVLNDIFSTKDRLRNTDQGRSLEAFWSLLLSQEQRDELEKLIENTLYIPEIQNIRKDDDALEDMKIRLIKAGEKVQKVKLSIAEQLSRYLDEKAYKENKRIIDIIASIESIALEIIDTHPVEKMFIEVDDKAEIEMVMNRPLWYPQTIVELRQTNIETGSPDDVDTSPLYEQFRIDKEELEEIIQHFLQKDSQISLQNINKKYPIKRGFAEILAYIDIASKNEKTVINEDISEIMIIYNAYSKKQFKIELPQIIFCRS